MKVKGYHIEPHANLWGANLGGADLRDANLWGANLRDADLRDANLWDADLRDANLWGADLEGANLWGANLWGADLRGANLRGANLRDADLLGHGINNYIKFAQFDTWRIGYTSDTLQIGCERHRIKKWRKFSDKRIALMDGEALGWWTKYKPLVMQMMRLCPAQPTNPKAKK